MRAGPRWRWKPWRWTCRWSAPTVPIFCRICSRRRKAEKSWRPAIPSISPRRFWRYAASRARRKACVHSLRRSNRNLVPRPISIGSINWLRMDKPIETTLRRSLLILAAVTLVTAWFSETFYFPDEHYQVLEFMAFKLGITQSAQLPWEFTARIRPWFQPLAYFLIAKPFTLAGMKDMFLIAFILLLATG